MIDHARSCPALRRLPALGAGIWLVRSRAREAPTSHRLVLFHVVPGLLDAPGKEIVRHG
jgi:hypothetical protein